MSAVVIRPIEVEDASDVQQLFNDSGVRWGTAQLGVSTVADWRKRLGEQAGERSAVSLGAQMNDHIIGMVSLGRSANPRLAHVAGLGIVVRDEYTGRGIGTALMAAILDLADNWLNVHRVELDVNVDNDGAVRLYEKFGFGREGIKRDLVFRAGRYVDCYGMARIRPMPETN